MAAEIGYRGERWIVLPGLGLGVWGIVSGYGMISERPGVIDMRNAVGLELPEGMSGWALLALSALLAAYCLWHFIAPMRVDIDDTGVFVRSPLYKRHFLWMEVERLQDATWFHVRLVLTPDARRRKGLWGFSPVLPRPPVPIQREFLRRLHTVESARPDPMGFV